MPKYYECLRCGVVTEVDTATPKCSQCGHGTGILHQEDPRKSRKDSDSGSKDDSSRPPGKSS